MPNTRRERAAWDVPARAPPRVSKSRFPGYLRIFPPKFVFKNISTSPAPNLPPNQGCQVCTIPTPKHPCDTCRTPAASVRPGTCQPQPSRNPQIAVSRLPYDFSSKMCFFSISTSSAPHLPPTQGCQVCTIPTPKHPRDTCRMPGARVRPGTCKPQPLRNPQIAVSRLH